MLRSYLVVALRHLKRHRGYAFINVAGMAVGIACCLLIVLFVRDELSYDRYHAHAERIYRLAAHVAGASYGENGIAKVTDPWGPAAVEQVPEVEQMVRFVLYGRTLVGRGERRFYETGGLFADPTVFQVFSWPLRRGDPDDALSEPNTVVLTPALAERYFPDEDPIGRTLTFDGESAYRVTGVLEEIPSNSHFTFDFLVSLPTYTHPDRGDWTRWNQFYTYVLLREGASPERAQAAFEAVLERNLPPDAAEATTPFLQPITRIHLHSRLWREMAPNSDVLYVYLFSVVALFLLVIACLNFINLATARASQRAQEVGIRKASGAHRGMLMRQFLGEALLLSAGAVLLAVGLVELVLPGFNSVIGKELTLDLAASPLLAAGLAAVTLVVGMGAGAYPALVLSSFRPVDALRGQREVRGRSRLRRGLVVFQFALSAFLITGTAVVYSQLDFIRTKNLGFEKDRVLTIQMQQSDTWQRSDTIREALLRIPGVERASFSANQPGGSDYGIPYVAEGLSEDERPPMRMLIGDDAFLATYGIEVVRGRGFSSERPADAGAFLINETAARQLGWADPLGKTLALPVVDRAAGPIIGVVRDFHFHSLHEPIGPLMIFMEPSWASRLSLKLRPDHLPETLAAVEEVWGTFEPGYPMVSYFVDDRFEQLYRVEARMGRIVGGFAGLAILIACLGLLGLAAYTTERRTKEIGIRKAHGASAARIAGMLSTDVLKLVGLAFALAVAPAYLAAKRWLATFTYGVEPGIGLFALVAAALAVLALATVGYQAIRAARINPVDALRYE